MTVLMPSLPPLSSRTISTLRAGAWSASAPRPATISDRAPEPMRKSRLFTSASSLQLVCRIEQCRGHDGTRRVAGIDAVDRHARQQGAAQGVGIDAGERRPKMGLAGRIAQAAAFHRQLLASLRPPAL